MELIVVIAIIGIIAALIVPQVTGYIQTAQERTHQANAQMLYNTAALYITDQEINSAKSTNEQIAQALNNGALFSEGYINNKEIDAVVQYEVVTTNGRRQVNVTYTADISGESVTYLNGIKQESTTN